MTDFTAFLPEVLPFVHDCPQIAAINALRAAAIEFCEKTLYWQADLDTIDSDAGDNNYQIVVPTGTVLLGVITGWYDGHQLIPTGADALDRLFRGQDWRSLPGLPRYMTQLTDTTLMLVPTPSNDDNDALALRVALAPSRTATGIDDTIYQRYLEVIAKGARARLYATPGAPYYDMQMSMAYQKEFVTGIGEARIKVNKGMTRASTRIEFRQF